MVKECRQPPGCGVAALTGGPKSPGMFIIRSMTGITISGSAQVNMVNMAGFTGSADMGTR
jgi:hypothetical protein